MGDGPRRRRFERLFDETYDRVLAYALRRTTPDEAQDVAAETFTVAWRRLELVPDEEPIAWLLGIARNVLSHHRRSSGRRARRAASGDPASAGDRELLRLVAWDGLEARHAAQVLGVPVGTFQVRLHRARKRLEQQLERTSRDATMTGGTR